MSAPAHRPDSDTRAIELPADETGQVPMSLSRVEPHWFGIAPAPFLLGLAVAFFVVALVLIATGGWPFGLILLGLTALLAALYLEAARRRPSTSGAGGTREHMESLLETIRARATATAEAKRLHSGLFLVESRHREAIAALGAAVHAGDEGAAAEARATLEALEAEEADLRNRLETGQVAAGERIRRARLAVQPTERKLPPQ